jgi:hypothetical protein
VGSSAIIPFSGTALVQASLIPSVYTVGFGVASLPSDPLTLDPIGGTVGSAIFFPAPRAGTLRNLHFAASIPVSLSTSLNGTIYVAPATGSNPVFAATTLTVPLTFSAIGVFEWEEGADLVNSVVVNAGDYIALVVSEDSDVALALVPTFHAGVELA